MSNQVNTLPNNKENKYTAPTEAQKECTCAAYALANSLQKANSGSDWRLFSEQVGGTYAALGIQKRDSAFQTT